jgi:hypothetical protein
MLPEGLQKYWNFRDEITVLDGLLYKSQRIMVPKTLQREMLVNLTRNVHDTQIIPLQLH